MDMKCKKCKRSNCEFYNRYMSNNCVALRDVYTDVYQCAFFKKVEKDREEE